MVKRTLLLGAALAVVGQSLLMAGPAIAKTKTRACPSVTVGRYEATDVRVTPNLGCAAAEERSAHLAQTALEAASQQ